MSFGHAIYYPHINITDKSWLKYALLYWDTISRIVPPSIEPEDSDDVVRIRSEIGFLEDYRPEADDVSRAASHFFHWFGQRILDPAFRQYCEMRTGHLGPLRNHLDYYHLPPQGVFGALNAAAQANGSYIHVEKLDPELRQFLFATGVAIPGEDHWRDWVKIDSDIGLLYMSHLARSISDHTAQHVVTDKLSMFVTSESIEASIDRAADNIQHRMATLLIAAYAPANLNAVTIDTILAFREKHGADRKAFFDHINALCNNMRNISSKKEMRDALNHNMPTLFKAAEESRKQYVSMRIDPAIRFIGISVPTACAALSDYVPVESKGLIVAAGMVLGMARAMHERRRDAGKMKANPLSYLNSLESGVAADRIMTKIRNVFKGFG